MNTRASVGGQLYDEGVVPHEVIYAYLVTGVIVTSTNSSQLKRGVVEVFGKRRMLYRRADSESQFELMDEVLRQFGDVRH